MEQKFIASSLAVVINAIEHAKVSLLDLALHAEAHNHGDASVNYRSKAQLLNSIQFDLQSQLES